MAVLARFLPANKNTHLLWAKFIGAHTRQATNQSYHLKSPRDLWRKPRDVQGLIWGNKGTRLAALPWQQGCANQLCNERNYTTPDIKKGRFGKRRNSKSGSCLRALCGKRVPSRKWTKQRMWYSNRGIIDKITVIWYSTHRAVSCCICYAGLLSVAWSPRILPRIFGTRTPSVEEGALFLRF